MPARELRVVLTVDDHERAVAFYRDALGLTELADWSSADGKVVLLDGGHGTLEIVDAAQAALIDQVEVGERIAGPVRLALQVDNLPTLIGVLAGAGADRLGEIVDTPWGDRNARLRAPDGMQLTLFTPADTPSQWDPALDGLRAAPDSHRLLQANDRVRVLEVAIPPGVREPEHTHRWPSVMVVDQPARIRYYDRGRLTFESSPDEAQPPAPHTTWLEPEGPHAVENIDGHRYHAYRVELLDGEAPT